jgi:hypothetical protein
MTNYYEVLSNGQQTTFTKISEAKAWFGSCSTGSLWKEVNGEMELIAAK